MKRKRRVEIQIEHREISIYSGAGPPPGQAVNFSASDGTGLMQVRHAACPACGSLDLALLTDAVARARLDLVALNQGMQDGSIHLHRSPSGEWWICNKSLQQTRREQ